MAPMKRPATGPSGRFGGTQSIETYARKTGCTISEVRRLMSERKLPFIQIDGQLRVDRMAAQPANHTRLRLTKPN